VFRSTLKGPPFEIALSAGDCGSYVAEVELARCDTRVVTLLCVLAGMTLDGEPFAEFSFSITIVCLENSFEPLETQNRNTAAGYIPADVRPMVMEAVCYFVADEGTDPYNRRFYVMRRET
jgi:hypothetical protein